MAGVFPTRIHIAPLGVEYERITEPAIRKGADRVILVKYLPKAFDNRLSMDRIQEQLEEHAIEIEYERCEGEINDLYDAVAKISDIIFRHSEDQLFVNLATGDKDMPIGGMIACMTTGEATPYYVEAETRGTLQRKPPEDVSSIDSIPPYPMERPTDEQLEIMNYIHRNDKVEKGDLIRFGAEPTLLPFLEDTTEVFEDRADYPERKKPTGAAFGRLNTHIINPLEERGFIETEEVGRYIRIHLTEDGKNMLRAFEHVVDRDPSD